MKKVSFNDAMFHWKNGKKDGPQTWWHESGQKSDEGHQEPPTPPGAAESKQQGNQSNGHETGWPEELHL